VSETKGRNLGLKILAICLVACMVMVPTTALSQIPSRVYNPLADINEDGKVDLKDLVLLVEAYGTNGTPINITELENQVTTLQTQVSELPKDFSLYNAEFGSVSVVVPSLNFSPPVSMYYALRIALESDGWNESSLINDTVRVSLDYWEFIYSPISSGIQWLHAVTQPVKDYSPVEINSTYGNSWSTTVYRYIWTIYVNENPFVNLVSVWQWHPLALYLVDAATGEIIPHGPIF
jgi:hypothetical protein